MCSQRCQRRRRRCWGHCHQTRAHIARTHTHINFAAFTFDACAHMPIQTPLHTNTASQQLRDRECSAPKHARMRRTRTYFCCCCASQVELSFPAERERACGGVGLQQHRHRQRRRYFRRRRQLDVSSRPRKRSQRCHL